MEFSYKIPWQWCGCIDQWFPNYISVEPQAEPGPAIVKISVGDLLTSRDKNSMNKNFFSILSFSVRILFFFSSFSGPHPQHMEIPRLGVESELHLPACATATATLDPSHLCNLHHIQQHWILNPLNEARDWIRVLVDSSQVCYWWSTTGTNSTRQEN